MTFAEWWRENQLDYLVGEKYPGIDALIEGVARRVWAAAQSQLKEESIESPD